ELFMTPPRSEAWAICLGAGAAMVWHMVRNGYTSALRVAFYAMLGAGFGFSFGNFLQITGTAMKIDFNWWNVMEYNIGFWGGSGMAYAVFTSVWPVENEAPKKYENRLSLWLILLIIPLLVWKDAFNVTQLLTLKFVQEDTSRAWFIMLLTLFILVLMVLIVWLKLRGKMSYGRSEVMTLFLTIFTTYIVWSYLVTGIFMGVVRWEQPLYVLNLLLFWWLAGKAESPFHKNHARELFPKDKWALYFGVVILIVFLLPIISLMVNGGFPNANQRFPI
ncbi:MAG TPA: hypothetical protein VN249_01350, partial [Prolixibacteraceae bacterium]|nr:hypothetical protein [Prolixibacteraceae bacterium]